MNNDPKTPAEWWLMLLFFGGLTMITLTMWLGAWKAGWF